MDSKVKRKTSEPTCHAHGIKELMRKISLNYYVSPRQKLLRINIDPKVRISLKTMEICPPS